MVALSVVSDLYATLDFSARIRALLVVLYQCAGIILEMPVGKRQRDAI
jgi:hypothetical protein